MSRREQNLEAISPILATFAIHQTAGADDLTDSHIGQAVTLTDNGEAGPIASGGLLLGKLISLTLSDRDNGDRLATVQIGGVCRVPISSTYPALGNRVVGGANGTVRQAPAVSSDPAGGNVGRGTTIAVNGALDCLLLLN